MSKYKEMILQVLTKTEIKNTNEVLEELQKKVTYKVPEKF